MHIGCGIGKNLGTNLGPITAENRRTTRRKTTLSQPQRDNNIAFPPLFRDQEGEFRFCSKLNELRRDLGPHWSNGVASLERMHNSVMRGMPALPTRTSSLSGKMPIPTSPSCSRQK